MSSISSLRILRIMGIAEEMILQQQEIRCVHVDVKGLPLGLAISSPYLSPGGTGTRQTLQSLPPTPFPSFLTLSENRNP